MLIASIIAHFIVIITFLQLNLIEISSLTLNNSCVSELHEAHLIPPFFKFSYKLSTSSVSKWGNLSNNGTFTIPSGVSEISVYCISSYPTKWIFFSSPLRSDINPTSTATNLFVDKTRKVNSYNINYENCFKYESEVRIQFRKNTLNRNSLNLIALCANIQDKKNPPNFIISIKTSNLLNGVLDGQVENNTENTNRTSYGNAQRYGVNKNCILALHLNPITMEGKCTENGNYKTIHKIPHFIKCSNDDECEVEIKSPTTKNNNDCEILIKNCTKSCTKLTSSPIQNGAFVCESEDGKDSIAQKFFYTLDKKPRIYFNRTEDGIATENLIKINRAQIKSNDSIYLDDLIEFNCSTAISRYSMGTRWGIKYQNGTELTENKKFQDSISENRIAYISKNKILFESENITEIICYAPIWNSDKWENVSLSIKVIPYKRPQDESDTFSIFGIKSIWLIVGGPIFVILLLALICYLYWRIIYMNREIERLTEEEIQAFSIGDPTSNNIALFYPYNTDFEISKKKIQFESKILGNGNFGMVSLGKVNKKPVAIKTIKRSGDISYLKALLSELKILCYIGPHENIVNLIGGCTENIHKNEVYVLYEYCSNGNILKFMKTSRDLFVDHFCATPYGKYKSLRQSVVDYQNASTKKLSSKDLIRWCYEIASGMEFLSSKNIIHGDLAARNILLNENLNAKVGDFGLSKHLHEYTIYVQKQACPLPLKWMAIESLRDLEFSIKSDVWSYGITLWEIFSLGETPYKDIQWDFSMWKVLQEGFRMEKPHYASQRIYEIILDCWSEDVDHRPTFKELKSRFAVLIF